MIRARTVLVRRRWIQVNSLQRNLLGARTGDILLQGRRFVGGSRFEERESGLAQGPVKRVTFCGQLVEEGLNDDGTELVPNQANSAS